MESLLSMAFDSLSSADPLKVRKGLRQVEGLLAQICLAREKASASPRRRSTQALTSSQAKGVKELSALVDDPAFLEFFKLQEGFEWNLTLRLIGTLERLLGKSNGGQNDLMIISCLNIMHGLLLLHPPSRALFARETHMTLLLDLLEPEACPAVLSSTLLTLVTALLENPRAARSFESLDGLLTITSLFKTRTTNKEVKFKLLEFIYFYLMPETPHTINNGDLLTGLSRSPSKLGGAHSRAAGGPQKKPEDRTTRTVQEKQAMLGKYMSNVGQLVDDLRANVPYGGVV